MVDDTQVVNVFILLTETVTATELTEHSKSKLSPVCHEFN